MLSGLKVGGGKWGVTSAERELEVLVTTNSRKSPYKRGIMIAPVAAKNRYLAYIAPRNDGVSEIFGVDAIQEFFPGVDFDALRRVPAKQVLSSPAAARDWAANMSAAIASAPLDV